MISIIIASANKNLLNDVSVNIRETIGVEYEIISFDNAGAAKGICEVYNKGIQAARYNLICFMHEDICIKTSNWGFIVQDCFDTRPELGLLGIAGGRYKTLFPCSWYIGSEKSDRYQLLQHFKHQTVAAKVDFNNPNNEKLSMVSSIDGVWFCTRREVLNEVRFDELLLKGFHGYDLDFSLNVGKKWDIGVTFDVLLEHFSEGKYDREWVKSILLVHKKWNETLPKQAGNDFDKQECAALEQKAFETLMYAMAEAGYLKVQMRKVLWNSKLPGILGWKRYFKMHCFISALRVQAV
ncbi:glycosyltransferase [Pedobacter africanus]|uniref:Glycosyltransferase like family protein n=1 Tax=Pedobacter africanus TaxID=151894 RepID=A0A1W2BEC8_9SPHI|nr:glycosyltransferase [Pedobacter africanus]SMC71151.1 Glycosyltransferase like family protein [Pedobacter africanus]